MEVVVIYIHNIWLQNLAHNTNCFHHLELQTKDCPNDSWSRRLLLVLVAMVEVNEQENAAEEKLGVM